MGNQRRIAFTRRENTRKFHSPSKGGNRPLVPHSQGSVSHRELKLYWLLRRRQATLTHRNHEGVRPWDID